MGSIQVVNTIENLKHLRNLKKWHNFIKISQILFRCEYTIQWALKPNWTPSAVWTWKPAKFEQIDWTHKNRLQKYFLHRNERLVSYVISMHYLEFAILTYLHWFTQRCAVEVEAFWRTSKWEGRVILTFCHPLCGICSNWIIPLYSLLPAFSHLQQYKIWN